MSTQPFSFPPPPPPPPKRNTEDASPPNHDFRNGRGSFRGGRAYRGNTRGGRGGYNNYHSGPPAPSMDYGPSRGRDFSHKPMNSGPQRASPASYSPAPVPNFNASIEHLLARKSSADQTAQKASEPKKPESRKQNLLGLTPAKFEQDSEPEDDEDEEQRLANKTSLDLGGHLFEHNGNPLMLRTREEIMAWLAERKRRYPTEARREAAKKEAEEQKRKRDEEYKARLEARREAQAKREQERIDRQNAKAQEREAREEKQKARSVGLAEVDDAARAKLKAEKLRKKAIKAQQQLEKAEEALRLAQAKKEDSIASVGALESNQNIAPATLDTVPDLAASKEEDETSSSGSSTPDSDSDSETDSDAAPEQLSTKEAARVHDLPPAPRRVQTKSRELCKHFARHKTCNWGSNCRYSHDLSRKGRRGGLGESKSQDQVTTTTAAGGARRKGLWQVMVEKEQDEERKRLLGAIITLGERGLLDSPAEKPDGSA